jgi:hypothetical protein
LTSSRKLVADGELAHQAQNNSIDNFRLVFDREFLETIITRVDTNDEIFKRIIDDEDFRAALGEFYLRYARCMRGCEREVQRDKRLLQLLQLLYHGDLEAMARGSPQDSRQVGPFWLRVCL